MAIAALCIVGLAPAAMAWLQTPPASVPQSRSKVVKVEPSDLEQREDLVGREVEVDDRVQYFVPRNPSTEDDELKLKRTSVTFLVPKRLRLRTWSGVSGVVVRGVLARDEGRLVCRVSAFEVMPNDLERLQRGIAALPPKDSEHRRVWAAWAERRASAFQDVPLLNRAKAVEAEALRLEGDLPRVGVDAPQEWLAKAQDARRRKIPEPEPSAWAHRALRAKLAAANNAAEVAGVIKTIESMFPDAAADKTSARVNLAQSAVLYAKDPLGAYRAASPGVRKALDRRLWADATEQLIELQGGQDLPGAIAMSERAAAELPEKPELPTRLLEKSISRYRNNIKALRLSEVKALAQAYRERLGQPDEAIKVLRDWLHHKRQQLSNTDAEGRVALANLHDELLQDRVTAVELLRQAWKIDPTSKEVAEAFRTRGFRKSKEDWVDDAPQAPATATDRPGQAPRPRGLLGLTPDEVRQQFGNPNRVNYVGSRGQLVEQWIYLDTDNLRYVNLLRAPGELKPRVIAHYALPKATVKGGLGTTR
jgi:hypothetical protein